MKKYLIAIIILIISTPLYAARYCAEIDASNVVKRVIVCDDLNWPVQHLGGTWVETWVDKPGHNYAGIGDIYKPEANNFHDPKPYDSWVLDGSLQWQPPVPMPKDKKYYKWDEQNKTWK